LAVIDFYNIDDIQIKMLIQLCNMIMQL
jgi:hypothetical protein